MRTSVSSSSGAESLVVLGALLVLPWSVVVAPGHTSFVFAWGLVTPSPLAVTTIYDYVFVLTRGLPSRLLAWPASVLLYAGALASAMGGRILDREDRRVTAALLALAGVEHAWFALGTSRSGVVVVPLATPLLWIAAWSAYAR